MQNHDIWKKEINISISHLNLGGILSLPNNTNKLVIFSHGSGSSRYSPRNNMVADILHKYGFGTLLFDLLTAEEDSIYENRFDIELLSKRMIEVTVWIQYYSLTKNMKIGYFGASTGAASALNAAAFLGTQIKTVVSRGGRPDLSIPFLHKVKCPVLLIVGALDIPIIFMNQQAYDYLNCIKELKIIDDATHLFDEPGKMMEVAELAAEWFERYLI